jgi:polyhydroxyalkanoate synthesis regulator phasin
MDHSLGESQNYHRPAEKELLDDYLNVVDLLTMNEENRLKQKLENKTQVEKSKLDALTAKIEKLERKYNKLKG